MKAPTVRAVIGLIILVWVLRSATEMTAIETVNQTQGVTAYNVQPGTVGNEAVPRLGVGNDFRVVTPIAITQLGVFNSGANGIQGSAVLAVQVYERNGSSGALLATLTFDATNPGQLIGGSLFKPLGVPLTLLPGNYSIVAYGFDDGNPEGNACRAPYDSQMPPWTMNDGGGLIQFGGSRYGFGRAGTFPADLDVGQSSCYAAGTFMFTATTLPSVPYATDYAVLTASVPSFPVDAGKSNVYAGTIALNHYGSIALLSGTAFPILVEPGGSRLILAAAATYSNNPAGARCVAFAHEQFGHSFGDGRGVLFENAIKWASRKSNPANIVMGLSTNVDASYFEGRGYQIRMLDQGMKENNPDPMPGCDVLVINFHGPYTERFMTRAAAFVANGGGLVSTFLPWRYVHGRLRPMFGRVNALLQPFGMAYRSSLTQPGDFGFTNIQSVAYPVDFQAYTAATLLHQDRIGQIQLGGQERAIALNTIAYAADGQPDLLAALTAIYSTGTTNSSDGTQSSDSTMGSVVDVVTMTGAQASTNYLGGWVVDGNALVAQDRRGGVEYPFSVTAAGIYRIHLEGTQNLADSVATNFELVLSVDGLNLGRYELVAVYGTNGVAECWTPYLLPGPHSLRVFWDNAANSTELQINAVRVQTATGTDSNGDGIPDWMAERVDAQSGLDATNSDLTSYTSPLCLEGRDPYPSLMQITVPGADVSTSGLTPQSAPNARWYANIPLANDGVTTVQVTYQNGAKSETRTLHWALANVLQGGAYTIRQGDSMVFVARPENGWSDNDQMLFTIGTNQPPARNASQQMTYQFSDAGAFTVAGTYVSAQGVSQSGNITVNVMGQSFAGNPDCWVGKSRVWDVPSVAGQEVLEADSELFCEQTATLPDNGIRLSVLTDEAEPRYILSRLGSDGPILASASANGFRVYAAPDTYNQVIETYPDGSRLVETMVILSPMLPDLTVQIRVLAGGVTLDDGTTIRDLTSADFDSLGQCKVRFLLPSSAKTFNCHSVTVIQGPSDMVGSY